MKVYAFDVDETLYLSHGPVQWEALVALRAEGHVLGLCGNWAAVTLQVPEWHRVLSFIGPSLIGTDKAHFLAVIKQYVPAEEHVMVGNDHSLRAYASPDDRGAADAAGWRFLSEGAFAAGADDWLFMMRDGSRVVTLIDQFDKVLDLAGITHNSHDDNTRSTACATSTLCCHCVGELACST